MSKVTSGEKWSYALGNIPYAVKDVAFNTFVAFYYTQVLGLSGTLTGLAMMIAVSWDAITDPIVGSWSDTVRSRWGRRHPLMLGGGVPMAFLFLALFNVPGDLSELQIFSWLLVVSVLLRTFLTINFIPYQAMGAELSTDYDERTVIAKARVTVAFLASLSLTAAAYLLVFQTVDGIDGRLVAANYWQLGVMSALLTLITVLMCNWGTRTAIVRLPQAATDGDGFVWTKPFKDFKIAAGNRNFRLIFSMNLTLGICAGSMATLTPYMATYFWEFSTAQLASFALPSLLGVLTGFVVLHRLGNRFDKPHLLGGLLLAFLGNILWFVGARLLGLLPENGDPLIYALQLLWVYFMVLILNALFIVAASLMADILDEQKVATGLRQEGVFFAAASFVVKTTSGIGILLAGIIVDLAGLLPGTAPGSVPESTLTRLGWANIALALLILGAWHFARKIQLSRGQVAAMRVQLDAKVSAPL